MREHLLSVLLVLLLVCGCGGGGGGGSFVDAGPGGGSVWQPPAFTTTRFIDGSLAADCAAQYDAALRACGAGTDTAYASFASATAAATPGTEFLVRGGSYGEVLRLTLSGSTTAYIGYSEYVGEEVIVAGVNSVDGGENYGPIWFDHVSYNVVRGFTVQGSVGFLRAVDSHHNIVDECDFNGSSLYPSSSKRGGLYFIGSHHNRVTRSRIYQGTDSLALIRSDNNLVEANLFELAGHDLLAIKCGSYNVVRGNEFVNPTQKLVSIFDCEAATMSWHGNAELAEPTPRLDQTKHNLVEGNLFRDTVRYYSTSGGNGIQYAAQDGIVRRNVFHQNNVGIGLQHYADEALYTSGNRIYNNVMHANYCGGISVRGANGVGRIEDNEYKNNILWDNEGWAVDCAGTSPAQVLYRDSMVGHRWVRNNIASSQGSTIIREEFGSEYALASFPESASFMGTLEVDPLFVNPAARSYALAAASPLRDQGRFLTTVASASGSGVLIEVADASYFYDGFGIDGEVGDQVQLEGQTETARVISVDYGANTLTLDRSLTWTQGAGFGLAYHGAAPDLGALE